MVRKEKGAQAGEAAPLFTPRVARVINPDASTLIMFDERFGLGDFKLHRSTVFFMQFLNKKSLLEG